MNKNGKESIIFYFLGILGVVALFTSLYFTLNAADTESEEYSPRVMQDESTIASSSSREWIDLMMRSYLEYDEECDIRTEQIKLAEGTPDATALSFEYVHCPDYALEFRDTGFQIIPVTGDETSHIDAVGTEGEGRPVADYWILDPTQDTETFIKSLIATLPTPELRTECFVGSVFSEDSRTQMFTRGELIYGVHVNQAYRDKYQYEVYAPCAPYETANSVSYFKRVGNILLFIHAGQDTPRFDATSFRNY
ncbi:MAG: hypothetical protein AB203_02900 [Parcubacteria bacterium C7867-008]|nr:MAG: hypothetical protein AB203_02900 [Parcubacteria bacterium C7867-008]